MSDSLRVALLLDPLTLPVKGGVHAPKLARELLGRGHAVRGFGAPPGIIPRSGDEGEGGHSWRLRAHPLLGFAPDVLVAYDSLSPAAMLGARAARRLDAVLMLVEHGLPLVGRVHTRVLSRVGELLWGRFVRRTAAGVVALDPVARDQAQQEGFPASIVSILPQGVDTTLFRPGLASGIVAQSRVRGRMLLYVGRLEVSRGVDTLIAAFARTVGQRGDWSLALAGEGLGRARLRAMADRLGVGDRVHWLPKPRPEELPGLLSAATLVAVPALDDTVLGRQIPRAMACGVPVLASDLPRLRFLVEPEATGLLAPAGNLGGWTDMIQRACSSPEARKRWGRNARKLAEERLSWTVVCAGFEELLAGAVDRHRRARVALGRSAPRILGQ